MFDTGGIAGQLARAHGLIADAAAQIASEVSGPQACEALREAVATDHQLTLTICLLTDRMERTKEFSADGAPTMARWLSNEAHSTSAWASQRVKTGRLLIDSLPATLAA